MSENVLSSFPLGVCAVSFNNNDLGLTSMKGATVKTTSKLIEVMQGKYGQVPTGVYIDGQNIEVDFELTQSQLSVLGACFPGVTTITSAGVSKLGFGLLAGTALTLAQLKLTPVLTTTATPDAQTGTYSPGFDITLTKAVPVGDFAKVWNGSEYVWPVKFKGCIDTGKSNGRWLAAVGDDSINADTTKPTVSTMVPANNATGQSVSTAIVWTMSETLNGNTVTNNTVQVFALPAGAAVTRIAGTVALVNNGASTTITFTPTSNLAATTKYLCVLTNEIQDPAGNTMLLDARQFTTT